MDNPINTTISQSVAPAAAQYSVDAAVKIDWFNFETRMRNLVKDMLEPSLDSQDVVEKTIKRLDNRNNDMGAQIQELEYQATRFDVIFKCLEDIESNFNVEKQSKDEDIQQLNIFIAELETKFSTVKHENIVQQEQIKKLEDEHDKLRKEQTMTNNRFVAVREDVLTQMNENSKTILKEMGEISTTLVEEQSKRKDFDKSVQDLREAIEKYSSILSSNELNVSDCQRQLNELTNEKVGIGHFDKLKNKLYRKLDELEQNNIKSTKEVFHMENYIRSLGQTIGGIGPHINHYSSVKYDYFTKNSKVKSFVEQKISKLERIPNWRRTRDDLFYLYKSKDGRFDEFIAPDQKKRKRKKSLVSPTRRDGSIWEPSKSDGRKRSTSVDFWYEKDAQLKDKEKVVKEAVERKQKEIEKLQKEIKVNQKTKQKKKQKEESDDESEFKSSNSQTVTDQNADNYESKNDKFLGVDKYSDMNQSKESFMSRRASSRRSRRSKAQPESQSIASSISQLESIKPSSRNDKPEEPEQFHLSVSKRESSRGSKRQISRGSKRSTHSSRFMRNLNSQSQNTEELPISIHGSPIEVKIREAENEEVIRERTIEKSEEESFIEKGKLNDEKIKEVPVNKIERKLNPSQAQSLIPSQNPSRKGSKNSVILWDASSEVDNKESKQVSELKLAIAIKDTPLVTLTAEPSPPKKKLGKHSMKAQSFIAAQAKVFIERIDKREEVSEEDFVEESGFVYNI
jgi:hypothetical protein